MKMSISSRIGSSFSLDSLDPSPSDRTTSGSSFSRSLSKPFSGHGVDHKDNPQAPALSVWRRLTRWFLIMTFTSTFSEKTAEGGGRSGLLTLGRTFLFKPTMPINTDTQYIKDVPPEENAKFVDLEKSIPTDRKDIEKATASALSSRAHKPKTGASKVFSVLKNRANPLLYNNSKSIESPLL